MSMTSIGDLAQHFAMRRHNADLNARLSTLVQEMATGQKKDISNPVTGDYLLLGDIERSVLLLTGYKQTNAEATLFADATQASLETVQTSTKELASSFVSLSGSATGQVISTLTANAKDAFGLLVGALNSSVAGRGLFGGTASNTAALSPAEDILSELRTATASATTPLEFRQLVEDWFVGPGFATDGYRGNEDPLTFQLSEGDRAENHVNANNENLRALMIEVSISALANGHPSGFSTAEKQSLLMSSGESLLASQDGLTGLRADIGLLQERIEDAGVRNASQQSAFELARVDIVAADPYETASQLETTRAQLEALYTVTARLSGLTLTSFLR